MKKLVLVVCTIALLSWSCKKETDSQMLAHRLEDIIKNEQVERVLFSFNTVGDPSSWTIYGDYGKHYSFDPPLVTVEANIFSLTAMKKFEIVTISGYKCMVLVF